MSEYLNLPKADYSSNLIAKWVFDNTDTNRVNGTTIYDLSGNGNNLTSVNVTYVDDADLGRCAYFNGNNSYAKASKLLPQEDYTIRFKVKILDDNSNTYPVIFDSRGASMSYKGIICFTYSGNMHIQAGNAFSQIPINSNEKLDIVYSFKTTHRRLYKNDLSNPVEDIESSSVPISTPNIFTVGRTSDGGQNGKFYISEIEIYNTINVGYSNNAYFIKDVDKIYSFKEDEYISPSYNEITETLSKYIFYNKVQWDIYKLFEETTIDGETFKPIDKFNSPQIISYSNIELKFLGRKSDKQLVVASNSFSTKIAENIDYFKATFNVNNNSYIKMAISVDEGQTWKTTSDNGTTWTDLTCTIPLKEYLALTADELIEWNNALTEIDTNGFNIADIENIDFNTIKDETIMFAYVLYQDTYDSICDNLSLDWQFDAKGKMQKMKDSEVEVSLLEDKVIVTPTIDNDMIKVNILNGVPEGTGSGDIDITEATSEDIQNILNKEW